LRVDGVRRIGQEQRLPDADQAKYRIAAVGVDARAEYARFGWLLADVTLQTKVQGDRLCIADVRISRMWSTVVARRSGPVEGFSLALIVIDGSLEVLVDGIRRQLSSGQFALINMSQRVEFIARKKHAVIEVVVPTRELPKCFRELADDRMTLVDGGVPHSLVTIVNSILNERSDASLTGRAFRRRAIVNMLSAALVDGHSRRSTNDHSYDRMVNRARDLIEENYLDPTFNGAALVKMMHVSRSHLYRAFISHGRTPRQEILDRRLREAARQLGGDLARIAGETSSTVREIAESSGFANRRSLLRAVSGQSDDRVHDADGFDLHANEGPQLQAPAAKAASA
jgi:AraC-like DNA-binding protein